MKSPRRVGFQPVAFSLWFEFVRFRAHRPRSSPTFSVATIVGTSLVCAEWICIADERGRFELMRGPGPRTSDDLAARCDAEDVALRSPIARRSPAAVIAALEPYRKKLKRDLHNANLIAGLSAARGPHCSRSATALQWPLL